MHSLYVPIKYTHMFFVVMTIILFNLRFWLRTRQPEKPLPVLLRVLPHISDSFILFTGMLMEAFRHGEMVGHQIAAGGGVYRYRRVLPACATTQRPMVRALRCGHAGYLLHCLFGAVQTGNLKFFRRVGQRRCGMRNSSLTV